MSSKEQPYIASLDVGTSTVKCHIFDKYGQTVGKASSEIDLLYPEPGFVEIHPEQLWDRIVFVMKEAIKNSGVDIKEIKCLGISSQRCTFITWNKKTGKSYHNFITWKDLRADDMVKELNRSLVMKALRLGSKFAYGITGSRRYLAGSVIKFMNPQVSVRLLWALKNIDELSKGIEKEEVLLGTVDTWVLYRLTCGTLHVTDVSCASATGLFDPFTLSWAGWALKLLGIPPSLLPKIVDSAGTQHLGYVDPSILGTSIPITASIADQSASLYGSRCFDVGDLKVTLGTGTFLNVNTGSNPHASVEGLYPVIGWKYKDELIYLAEGASNDTGALTKWAVDSGLVNDISESADVALSVQDNGGVYFVPAFSGMQAPINDTSAGSGFIGVSPNSRQPHLLRAILESIVYRVAQLHDIFIRETKFSTKVIKVDGGVSQNNFIMQFLADLTNVPVERTESTEMSVLGAAYLAGLAQGIWKDKKEILNLERVVQEFHPQKESLDKCQMMFNSWLKAVSRFCGWYSSHGRNLQLTS